jgi:hypothetical protein
VVVPCACAGIKWRRPRSLHPGAEQDFHSAFGAVEDLGTPLTQRHPLFEAAQSIFEGQVSALQFFDQPAQPRQQFVEAFVG